MKKLLILLIVVSCFFSPTYSQVNKIPYTIKELDGKMRDQYHSILGYDANGFYALKTKTKGVAIYGIPMGIKAEISIDYVNQDLEVERTILLELADAKNSVEFLHFVEDQNILKIAYSSYNDETTKLFIGDVDLKSGKVSNANLIFSESGMDRRGTFDLTESSDKSIFGLFSIVPSKEGKLESKVFTAAFDSEFKLLKQNLVIIPLKAKSSTSTLSAVSGLSALTSRTELIDQNGNISFLIRIGESKLINFGMPEYNYHVIKISDEPGKFQSTHIGKDESYFLKGALLNEDENRNIICVASYSEEKNVHHVVRGLVVYTMESDNFEDIKTQKIEFSESQISQILPRKGQTIARIASGYLKKSSKANAIFLNLNFSRINSDGSISLFSELFHSYYVQSSKTEIARTVKLGGDIFEMNISDGQLNSITTIEREFNGDIAYIQGSYLHGMVDGEDILMFLDTESFDLKYAIRNEFGEYKESYIPNIKKNKDFKKRIISYHSFNLKDDRYQYLFMRNKSKFYITKLDLGQILN
ncbi:hypothetical protein J2X69_003972 [Algoriphagus sp. 4150]|uniref:hypothetical protein n=1 Tax=Algoriphagus sp. 4150 TaxID=2817756 RepID=UPI00285A217F|nr:hypothetical protein [Algoriphagus sp. 4150]MDR7131608.1 hypothetical protein [Algoriphagus sp. 4150]